MTQIDVLKMAIEAGLAAETSDGIHVIWYPDNLHHFAKLAAAREREACAKVCDDFYLSWIDIHGRYEFMGEGANECASAIRARGEQA